MVICQTRKPAFVAQCRRLLALSLWMTGGLVPQAGVSADRAAAEWAYQAPRKTPPPATRNSAWPRNAVDRYILARLESRGLQPNPPADGAVLARRLYYDLTGLPPTPEQIDELIGDRSPEGMARVVERLLGSPHFGERWGRHWLDVVRYAESMTLRGFVFKEAWRYRDYVIDSFNRDHPFDRFLKEQLAGDLLPSDSIGEERRQRIATTFLVLGNINLEEQDKKQLDMDVVDEQLDTIGKAFLGQTIGCARCHDHKFDPISARDYYAMAGVLRSVQTLEHSNVSKWLDLPLPMEAEQEKVLQEHEAMVKELQGKLKQATDRAAKLGGAGAKSDDGTKVQPLAPADLPGVVVDDLKASKVGGWVHSQHTKSYIGGGYLHDGNSEKGQKTVTFQAEVLHAGRYEVRLSYTPGGNRATRVPVEILHADGESRIHVNQQESPPIDGRFVSLGLYRFEANGQGYVLISNEGTTGHVIADAVQFLPVDKTELARVQAQPASPTDNDTRAAQEKARAEEEVKHLGAALKDLIDRGPKREWHMSVKEGAAGDIRVHKRGSVHNLGESVPRGFLRAAMTGEPPLIPAAESGRRELAEWIASPTNPLTARVMVNRVWNWLIGAGLVRTPDNFGTTGELPSHPELLDFLAIRFVEEGWSVKSLVREIVLSQTYQLSSATSPSGGAVRGAEVDPENRLLWRMNRRRIEAEFLRDSILFVSGQLELTLGGPTIQPGTSADYGYKHTELRRSVYVPVFRNAMLDLFETFDFANPSMVTGRRDPSTVAPQALYLMNHPFVIEQAREASRRFLAWPGLDDAARVGRVHRVILGRPPSAGEMNVALKHLAAPSSDGSDAERVERWAQFAQALFASVDFRYID